MLLCEYGCNQEALFSLKNGKKCCSKHSNSCPKNREKNSLSLKKTYKEGNRTKNGFASGSNYAQELQKRSLISRINNLKKRSFENWGKRLKRELILEEQDNKCLKCKIEQIWNDKPIVFELDHIDGNKNNNKRENLQLICPNCHSQTPSFRGRGTPGYKKIKVDDNEIIKKLKELKNINQVLNFFNYSKTKGIYDRCYKIIKQNNLEEIVFEDLIKEKVLNNLLSK